jgi:hypothetical protein
MEPTPGSGLSSIDRRLAVQWMLAAGAAAAADRGTTLAATSSTRSTRPPIHSQGYGRDPQMVRIHQPGDVWPLTLDPRQQRITKALCDIVVPAQGDAPFASAVSVPEFLDEWVSAPYPEQAADRLLLLDGLEWLDTESRRLFLVGFEELDVAKQTLVCEQFAEPAKAAGIHPDAAKFFKRFRDLAFGGYVTTAEGMKALGYTGNIPLSSFEGPTPEALRHLGLV